MMNAILSTLFFILGLCSTRKLMGIEDRVYLVNAGRKFLDIYALLASFLFLLSGIAWLYLFPQDFHFFCRQLSAVLILSYEKASFSSIQEIPAILYHVSLVVLALKYFLFLAIFTLALREKRAFLITGLLGLAFCSVLFDFELACPFILGSVSVHIVGDIRFKIPSSKWISGLFIFYLWSWALVVLVTLMKIEVTPVMVLESCLILLALGILTEYFASRVILVSLPRNLFLLIAFLMFFSYKGKNYEWFSMNRFYLYDKIRSVVLSTDFTEMPKEDMIYRSGKGKRGLVFIGDQQLLLLSKFFLNSPERSSFELNFIYQNSCLDYLSNFFTVNADEKCFATQSYMQKLLADKSVERVVLTSYWYKSFRSENHLSPAFYDQKLKNLTEIIFALRNSGKEVFVIGNFPFGDELDPSLVVKRSLLNPIPEYNFKRFDKQKFLEKFRQEFLDLKEAVILGKGRFIDPLEFICNEESCAAFNEVLDPLYMDSYRIRPQTLASRGKFLEVVFE